MRKSFAAKLGLFFSFFIIALISFFLVFFNNLIRESHLKIIYSEMNEKLLLADIIYRDENAEGIKNNESITNITNKLSALFNLRVTVISFDGKVLADSEVNPATMDNHLYRSEIQSATTSQTGFSIRHSATVGTDTLYAAKRFSAFIVRIAKPLHDIDRSVATVRNGVLIAGCISFIIAMILIIIASRKFSQPIRETRAFASDFAAGRYDRRILNYTNDEIGEVQRALNTMAAAIDKTIHELSAEKEKLHTTFETIPDGLALISTNGRIILANKSFAEICSFEQGYSGKFHFELIRSSELNSAISRVISNSHAEQIDNMVIFQNNFEVHLRTVGDGTDKLLLVLLHDVTEARRIEKVKSDLVGNMSHELKTPIAIMRGYLETILDNLQNPETCKPLIERAIDNADRQTSLINDILKLHMMESSREFQQETVNITDVINRCADLLAPKAAQKDIALKYLLGNTNITANANRFLAEEIFFNLIDNAISYNIPAGTVILLSETNNENNLIHIEDSGIGIPTDEESRIFERFYRVEKSRSRATGGTGLGLSIVKHAVDLLGWKISVTRLEKGTRFTVEIPFK